MHNVIKLGLILMIYTLVAGTSLSYVNIKTTRRIFENKLIAENEARAEVLPDMAGGYEPFVNGSDFLCWTGYFDAGKSRHGGYVFIVEGSGYSSTIKTMVGVDQQGVITGVKILFQQETPGLGAKVEEILYGETEPWFTRQFKGKTTSDNIKVTEDGGNIDSITGATISSRTVTNSINKGLAQLVETVGGGS